jgi:hypothetical protein
MHFLFKGLVLVTVHPEHVSEALLKVVDLIIAISDGIDDETWLFHLQKGDISDWFREMIKDDDLADKTEVFEKNINLSADESRVLISSLIEKQYTAPA